MELREKDILTEKVMNGICHSFNEHDIPSDVGISALATSFMETVIEMGWGKEDVFEIVDFLYDRISRYKKYLR